MIDTDLARNFANDWVNAWNAHDLEAIVSHYAANVVLVSPTVAKVLGTVASEVKGKEALRSYFARGLEAYPDITFELVDVLSGLSSVVLYYVNQNGTKTGEFMEFDETGKVFRVVANYSI